MTQHDPLVRLRHMLDHAREAVEMTRGRQRADLNDDRMLELSLVRLVEIVGEAASRITRAEQARYSIIPWAQVTGMRHRLVHGYDTVDLQVLLGHCDGRLAALDRCARIGPQCRNG